MADPADLKKQPGLSSEEIEKILGDVFKNTNFAGLNNPQNTENIWTQSVFCTIIRNCIISFVILEIEIMQFRQSRAEIFLMK